MKKLFSVLLSALLLLFTFSPCFGTLAAGLENKVYEKKSAEIKELSNELNALIDKYDDNLSVETAKFRANTGDGSLC